MTSAIPCHSYNFDFLEEKINKEYVDTSEKFALNLLYIHVKVLAKNLFCVN